MNAGHPFRNALAPVDGQRVVLKGRSPLLYSAFGVAVVIDIGAFVALLRLPSGTGRAVEMALTWGYGLVLVAGLGRVAFAARGFALERQKLRTLVRRSNAAAREGELGVFEGVVVEGDEGTFTSHVSEKPSVFSEVTVEASVRRGNITAWEENGSRRAGVSFYLDDESGAPLLVDPNESSVVVEQVNASSVMMPSLEAVLVDLGLDPEIVARDAVSFRWFERTLSPGEIVSVIGRVREKPRRIEIEPGSAISSGVGARAALAQLGAPMEKALVASLVPFGIVAVAVVVIGALLSFS